jgi:hypothetical protein
MKVDESCQLNLPEIGPPFGAGFIEASKPVMKRLHKSGSVSPWSGRVIIAQQFTAGTTGEDIIVREADG